MISLEALKCLPIDRNWYLEVPHVSVRASVKWLNGKTLKKLLFSNHFWVDLTFLVKRKQTNEAEHSTVSHTCLCLKMSSSKFACSVSACEIHQILPEAERLLFQRASLTVHIMFWDPSVLPKILSYSSLSWIFSTCEGLSCWQRHCWAFWIAKRKPNENMKLKYGTANITLQGTNNIASYGKGMVPTTSSKKGLATTFSSNAAAWHLQYKDLLRFCFTLLSATNSWSKLVVKESRLPDPTGPKSDFTICLEKKFSPSMKPHIIAFNTQPSRLDHQTSTLHEPLENISEEPTPTISLRFASKQVFLTALQIG